MAVVLKQTHHGGQGLGIVFNEKDIQAELARLWIAGGKGLGLRGGEFESESGALIRALRGSGDRAAMKINEFFSNGQAQTQSTETPGEGLFRLFKRQEKLVDNVGTKADAAVGDSQPETAVRPVFGA